MVTDGDGTQATSSSIPTSNLTSGARPGRADIATTEFYELTVPDFVESSLQDFDMDELLEADLSFPEDEGEGLALDGPLASSTSPEDGVASRESTYDMARSNSSSGQ